MPEQDNWKEEFDNAWNNESLDEIDIDENGENSFNWGKSQDRVRTFIEKTISSQSHALKEKMKACVPEAKQTTISYKGEQKPHKKFKTNVGFNDCREQTLSAIESIEI